ncbi:phospholipase D family protein [Thauera linaloolentis]|uniref:phospholipase D n=1 Tax=Thauera linaloolentis (strain DSM 12138 / JCM 21573 / CCUG 41526 / CIP 105981 / IAM 15112 / NBRC 102519 / 47Lol) TaxID=1123367 RepID=N6Y8X0_THAL4|nr:phospholipase D family protein [Thauera linaloolentis]ENO87985.1 endonuclease [Thauera linaloolentis 47Lol = DSM 12138]MCM8567078.1 phospholipase D family protein [Thauera linaloolentis]
MPDRAVPRPPAVVVSALALWAGLALSVALPASAAQRFAAKGEVEVAFTPRDDAESLLVGVIERARSSLHVQAYAFTSRRIARAMVAAHRRGVEVQVLADAQMNRNPKGNALPILLAGGVPVAVETEYKAAHNKVLIADADGPGCTVLTGSYNFTWSAQNRNAENILVLRGHCELAQAYRDNWLRHRREAMAIASLPFRH